MNPEALFKAMSDPTRCRMVAVLQRDELNVTELVEVLKQPQSTVSRHLKTLRDVALIRERRAGATVLHSTVRATVQESDGLPARILEWMGTQQLPPSMASRLDAVVHRRADDSAAFFDRIGRQWDTLREESFGDQFHLEALIALLPSSWAVADIGSGTGYLLPVLSRHFRRVIGVEPAQRMLEVARQRVKLHDLGNVDIRQGELGSLPLDSASTDLAIATLVMHHVPSPLEALKEINRVVKPGGSLLIVEQVAHTSESFRRRMQDRCSGFEPPAFVQLLESVGFDEVRSTELATVERGNDAPELFAVTAIRGRA